MADRKGADHGMASGADGVRHRRGPDSAAELPKEGVIDPAAAN